MWRADDDDNYSGEATSPDPNSQEPDDDDDQPQQNPPQQGEPQPNGPVSDNDDDEEYPPSSQNEQQQVGGMEKINIFILLSVQLIRQKDRIVLMSAAGMQHVKMGQRRQAQQPHQQADDQSSRLKETRHSVPILHRRNSFKAATNS